jgi:uncharacterized protein HemY
MGLAVTSVLAIAAGFILASLLFTALLIAGLVGGVWLWWQWRKLTRQTRQTRQTHTAAPMIIEGEYTIETARPLLEDWNAPDREPPATLPPRQDA